MFKKFLNLSIISAFFIACSDNKIDSNLISNGTNYSQDSIEKANNLDKKSYEEIAHLFKDNTDIKSDKKNILLIFSANNCIYCDKLKEEILKDKNLQKQIKDDYSSYYINISYKKIHTFTKNHTSDLSTSELASLYNINATPTIVILNQKSQTLLNYPGFISAKRLAATMDFLNKAENQNLNEAELGKKLLHFYKDNKI
ncbi:thioredoxin family protein [Campylobacter volucris]|uniref:SoxW family protein n=1 Tax=Campylobacter volucris TaxID=1031542 RepID=UPI001059F3F1|nr:thioredoxin family protein [Campylobacter volucris]MBF7046955.1 thioredoxin family protein [Campylobacter volucris]TDJ81519.1 thioredoxin [Campylobacter volucris]